ncbi:MAG: sulfite exporter TauE/SafE family protein, partial [Candidatus Krumholzibacteria bacterium]|nr:sulfite exporter TauE/SafE family protein [Candidatus Krumholzibacteria bacterium]
INAASAQDFLQPAGDILSAKAYVSFSNFHPGSSGYLAVTADIEGGWHINSNRPLEEYLIPTVLVVEVPEGIEVIRILYPESLLEKLEVSENEMSLYSGRVNFGALLEIGDKAAPGPYTIKATLSYQGCNNVSCLEPASVTIETSLNVGSLDETAELLHPGLFSKSPFVDDEGQPVGIEPQGAGEKKFGGIIAERGLLLAFLFIFLGGLALNLTPCIYPLIPITVSYFVGQTGGKTSRTFLLALVYVLGMSITYSVLGTIAAITGGLFGSALQNPWVIAFICAVLIGLATSMFGLWELRMPIFLMRRTGSARQGYPGALFMGLTVGIVAAPCIGPFVIGLLTYVGEIGKPILGFLMFFTLAWGMGVPFIVLGMISGNISHLPRSGDWMVWVRNIFGFILIAMAFYFARHLIGGALTYAGYGLTALVAGIYLGWLDRKVKGGRGFSVIRKLVG